MSDDCNHVCLCEECKEQLENRIFNPDEDDDDYCEDEERILHCPICSLEVGEFIRVFMT
jgi:hypothetical protein